MAALREMVVLPGMMIHFDLSRKKSIRAAEKALEGDGRIFLTAQKRAELEEVGFSDLYGTGCIASVRQMSRLPDGLARVMVEGLTRASLCAVSPEEKRYLLAEVESCEKEEGEELPYSLLEGEAMGRSIRELFSQYCTSYPRAGRTLLRHMDDISELGQLLDQIAENLPVDFRQKQRVLDALEVPERYEVLAGILSDEIEVARIRGELSQKVRERLEKNQKEYVLREQLRYIRQELGDDEASEQEEFERRLSSLKASAEIKEEIRKHIARLKTLVNSGAEYSVERSYIDTLLDMPWERSTRDNTDLGRAEAILERDHYGLEQVKDRVLEFLAVRSFTKKGSGTILCLVGPPGTGKTSIAQSVAEALGRKYVRVCLGGVRDEAEIRGHRRTYIGSMPGRIADALRQAGVKNPLMLLDEIDKVSSDYKGDVASALLEVLDGEQNAHFRDHYLELPLNLSEVLFIATANTTDTIARPLLDRMEVVEVASYTANEKFHIAKEHLLAKQIKKNGLDGGKLKIGDAAIREIIESYTREAGVRELERKIGAICRKAARELLQTRKTMVSVNARNLGKYLGKRKYLSDKANERDEVGVVRGLAWTSVGGETLQIEVNVMPGKGEVELTGQLGDVMKESAMAGISYIRSVSARYGIGDDVFRDSDFHIHIPEGAVPKDGPSAGITMAAAVLSALTDIPVRADVAMTGEITLRGRILPIGGLKEKLLAAKTAGIRTVLIPHKNRPDVEEISSEIRSGMELIFVSSMDEVVEHAFRKEEKP